MRTKLSTICLVGVCSLVLMSWGCATTYDRTENVVDAAQWLKTESPAPFWQIPLEEMVVDSMITLPGNRLMAGVMALGKDRRLKNKEYLFIDGSDGSLIWRVPRKESVKYRYAVITVAPLIIIEERTVKEAWYRALDLENKRILWEKRVESGRISRSLSLDQLLYVALKNNKEMEISGVSLRTGDEAWIYSMPSADTQPPAILKLPDTDEVLLYGGFVTLFSPKDGKKRWMRKDIGPRTDRAAPTVEEDRVYVQDGSETVYCLRRTDGSTAWKRKVQGAHIISILVSDTRLFVMSRDETGNAAEAGTEETGSGSGYVTCLAKKSGRVLWRYEAPGPFHSSLYEDRKAISFTAGDELIRLDKTDGALILLAALPFDMLQPVRLPEKIRILDKSLVIANETDVASFSIRDGRVKFEHHVEPITDYSGIQRTINHNLSILAKGGSKQAGDATLPSLHDAVSRTHLDLTRTYETMASSHTQSVYQRTSSVLSSPRSTRLQRHTARQERMAAIESEIGATNRRIEAERSQATLELTMAVADVGAQLAMAYIQARLHSVDQGALEQAELQLAMVNENYAKLFYGDYYIRPYRSMTKGSGITMINMKTGERIDVVTSPLNYSLEFSGQMFSADLDHNKLYVSGIGLDHTFYRTTKISEFGMINIDYLPSIICYDLKVF